MPLKRYKPRGKPASPGARLAFLKQRSAAAKKGAVSSKKMAKLSLDFHKP